VTYSPTGYIFALSMIVAIIPFLFDGMLGVVSILQGKAL